MGLYNEKFLIDQKNPKQNKKKHEDIAIIYTSKFMGISKIWNVFSLLLWHLLYIFE